MVIVYYQQPLFEILPIWCCQIMATIALWYGSFHAGPFGETISICHIAMTEDFKLSTINCYPPLITSVLSVSLQEFSGRVTGMKVDAVDTTGAGDAFVAGILSQLSTDLSLLQVTIFLLFFISTFPYI